MKTKLTKIISMLSATAIVLGSGFTAIPKPDPSADNPIVIIEIDSDDEGDEAKPQIDESELEIDQ